MNEKTETKAEIVFISNDNSSKLMVTYIRSQIIISMKLVKLHKTIELLRKKSKILTCENTENFGKWSGH